MAIDTKLYEKSIEDFYAVMEQNKDLAEIRLSDDKWTLKEMVGHLIDSASNNHQRFIRLQINERLTFPAYDAEEWKDKTKIQGYDFLKLINLWKGYNYYLIHLVNNIEGKKLANVWETDNGPVTLGFLIEDYFGGHLGWHVELYNNRIVEIRKQSKIGI